jgi:CBS-domain-containing membrane protein
LCKSEVDNLSLVYHPDIVVSLAAQAGVTYSIENYRFILIPISLVSLIFWRLAVIAR